MIIALDPSGNWNEGKGTTGICCMSDDGLVLGVDEIHAGNFDSPEDYWHEHLMYLNRQPASDVVMEGFRLYATKKNEQVNSQFETPQLIGVIRLYCHRKHIPLKITYAVEVKNRWSDAVLERSKYIYKKNGRRYLTATDQLLNNHKTDALRHAIHYYRYGRKGS